MLALLARRAAARVLSTAPVAAAPRQPLQLLRATAASALTPLLTFTAQYATAAKNTTASTTKKTSAAKKPAAKKPAVKKPAAKKAAPKRKATKSRLTSKAKKPTKKAAPKKKAVVAKKKSTIPPIPHTDRPPKRALSAYNEFTRDYLNENSSPGVQTKEIMAGVGNAWRALSDAQKATYIQRSDQSKAEYAKAKEEYFKNTDPKVLFAINRQRANSPHAATRAHKPRRLTLPREYRRPLNAFLRFSTGQPAEGLTISDKAERTNALVARAKDLAAKWKAMSDAEKKPYYDAYQRENAAYEERISKLSRTLPTSS